MLAGGFSPTGSITFTLFRNGGTTPVVTETVACHRQRHRTPLKASFTLPTNGTADSTYQWDASYNGDTNNIPVSDNGSANEQVTVSAASPTITTTPDPTTVTLSAGAPPILKDSAVLAEGFSPTGTVTFTLFQNGGTTPVDTETVTVTGNGTYTTPTGFTLPTTGTVTGTYQWDASYGGDPNNNPVSENGSANEQVTVSAASPTITTTPDPTTVTLNAGTPPILKDSAVLAGGCSPTGTVTFTLFYNSGTTPVDTETVTVTGNGTYTTPTGFTLPTTGTITGTYQWDASYSGDANNNRASDSGSANERVTVFKDTPTITTTPSPTTVTLSAAIPPILTDSAVLAGGSDPTGTITFTLFFNSGTTPVDTETVTVNGNGAYTTPAGFTLPTTGTVAGTYQWDASYSGDTDNAPVSDSGSANEQVTVSAASPTISTTAIPTTVMLGGRMQDSSTLAGGYHSTGSITFNLYAPGVNPTVGPPTYTETVTGVAGNGTYQTTAGFTSNATGIWHWVATYNGDSNNNSVTSGALDEPVTVPPAAELALTKTVSNATPNIGDTIIYTVTLTNSGPDVATNVQVTDRVPSGVLLVSAMPTQGTYDPNTGLWSVGTVNVGSPETLVTVVPGRQLRHNPKYGDGHPLRPV